MIAPAPTMSTCKGCGCPIEVARVGKRREFCGKLACYTKVKEPNKDCEHCGKRFFSRPGTGQRFCCKRCKYAGEHVDHWKQCVVCERKFLASHAGVQSCSPKCSVRLRRAAWQAPTTAKLATELLEGSPTEIVALADWFRSLKHDQLDAVWVQAIIEKFDIGTMGPIAAALAVVRASYRINRGTESASDRNMLKVQRVISPTDYFNGHQNRKSRANKLGRLSKLTPLP